MLPRGFSAHHAHRSSAPPAPSGGPSHQLDADAPWVHDLLEMLDDAIFTAIAGCKASLDNARQLWPQVITALGPAMLEESREQYLRYAVEISASHHSPEYRTEQGAYAALEIIEMLTRG